MASRTVVLALPLLLAACATAPGVNCGPRPHVMPLEQVNRLDGDCRSGTTSACSELVGSDNDHRKWEACTSDQRSLARRVGL